jgi:plastocyanin
MKPARQSRLVGRIPMKPLRLTVLVLGLAVGPALAADTMVVQKGLLFSRSEITVGVGDTVRWSNADDATHNIHIKSMDDEYDEDFGLQKPGVTVAHKFDRRGVYRVICSIHPRMKMIVTVR